MADWDPKDPVTHRTAYYERIRRDGKDFLVFLPYYTVTYPGMGGRVFEPVDCLTRRQLGGGTESTTSQKTLKQVNDIKEFHSGAKLFLCEERPDGTDLSLHGLGGWGWPP